MTSVRWRLAVSVLTLHLLGDVDFSFGCQLVTPVEQVHFRPISQTKLGPVSYKPSIDEKPFFDRLEAKAGDTENATNYDIKKQNGQLVGWFGIVRKIEFDKGRRETHLILEHKYFDGRTDSHQQTVSFSGSGDFKAILKGTKLEGFFSDLRLMKVYGTVSVPESTGTPTVEVEFARCWDWKSFSFINAAETQRGSEEWQKLNTIPLEQIYSDAPDERYYVERLGPTKGMRRNATFDRLARAAAVKMGFDLNLLRDDSGAFRKRISPEEFRTRAINSTMEFDPKAISQIEPIINAILEKDFAVDMKMQSAINANAKRSIAKVLGVAMVFDSDAQYYIVNAYLGLAPIDAQYCIPELIEALGCEDFEARRSAAKLLGSLGNDAEMAIPALIQSLSESEWSVSVDSTTALGAIRRRPELVIPALLVALHEGDSMSLPVVLEAIGAFGHQAKEHAFAIARFVEPSHAEDVRREAALALGAMGNAVAAVPGLINALDDESFLVQRAAATGLKQLGPQAGPAIPKLKFRLQAKDSGVRIAAAEALWHIEKNTKDSLPILSTALSQYGFPTSMWASKALNAFGPAAKSVLPSLLIAVRNKDTNVKVSAIQAIGSIGPDAKEALTSLKEMLADTVAEISSASAAAIWKVDRDPRALNHLLARLETDNADLKFVIGAISEIGEPASAALPLLQRYREHPDRVIRELAENAIEVVQTVRTKNPQSDPAAPPKSKGPK